jgi:hypothetical protein
VASSGQGLHTWDSRLTDYSEAALAARRARVTALAGQVRGMEAAAGHATTRSTACSSWPSSRALTSSTASSSTRRRIRRSTSASARTRSSPCSRRSTRRRAMRARCGHRAPAGHARAPRAGEAGAHQAVRALCAARHLVGALDGRALRAEPHDAGRGIACAGPRALVAARDAALVSLRGFADWLETARQGRPEFVPWAARNTTGCCGTCTSCLSTRPRWPCWARPSSRATAGSNRSCPIRAWPTPIPRAPRTSPPISRRSSRRTKADRRR